MSTFTTESGTVANLVQNLPQEISLYIYTECV